MVVSRRAWAMALLAAAALVAGACGGGNESDTPGSAAVPPDASVLMRETEEVGSATLTQVSGRFGPDLEFVLRLPDAWEGTLVLLLPDADQSVAADPDPFTVERVSAGTATAGIVAIPATDALVVYRAFLEFARDQVRVEYGRRPDFSYVIGSGLGGWQAQRLLEDERLALAGVILVAPWSPGDALRDYPPLLRLLDRLTPAFPILDGGSLARLSAAELQQVEALFDLGLARDSVADWSSLVPFWRDALSTAIRTLDPGYALNTEGALLAYVLDDRPRAVRDAVDDATPRGHIAVRTLLLQGDADLIALPPWSQIYIRAVQDEDRADGLARYLFPEVGHALIGPEESAQFRDARLRRAWETLLGLVRNEVSPQAILGVDAERGPVGYNRGSALARKIGGFGMSVVTVSSQYGAGARDVARLVADRLSLQYVDQAVLVDAARYLGTTVQQIAEHDERTDSFRERLAHFMQRALERSAAAGIDPVVGTGNVELMLAQTYGDLTEGVAPSFIDDRTYRQTVTGIIQELAQPGDMVIIGRGSQMILRDRPNTTHIQLVADEAVRLQRVMQWESLSEDDAKTRMQEFNRSRAAFHKKFWKVDVWDPHLYNLVINTTTLSYAAAADLVGVAVQAQVGAVTPPRA